MSTAVRTEQRPEQEAMKKKAQQAHENAATYTSLGQLHFFIEKVKEMDISQYYSCAI